ncbi:MAG: endonuclease MutS2 [Candidatus Sumerlaeia bacterium]|nr:endonuclease MutS2 [Candidatus Sumerlaeia bacterium]
MDPHTEDVLEFGKIRDAVAGAACSDLGRERARKRPVSTDPDQIAREFACIAELYRLLDCNQEPPLDGLLDLRTYWKRVWPRNAILDPPELVQVADFCSVVARVRKFFAQHTAEAPTVAQHAAGLFLLHDVEYHIRQAIETNGEVKDNASPRLRELRGEIRALEAQIQHTLERLMRTLADADVLQDEFITQRQGRYVLPVKAGAKGKLRGIVHDASHSGETFFIEPFPVVEMTNDLTERRVAEREEVRKILIALCDAIREQLPSFEHNTALLADLDEQMARARFGYNRRWTLPQRQVARPLRLISAHHPLLVLHSPETSVPLDLPLDSGDCGLIISGPNAGGKTTALKAVGLLTLMVQWGMPVPADPASNFRIFRRILADIGDEQDVTSGVSTFSSHIRRIAQMLAVADNTTLVLLDELGTATDPTEGGALAVAIVESLLERGSLTLVTSHLGALKAWAENHPRARNASFHLDPSTRRPTYRLRLDVPGVSEALIIAAQQGLDRRVIERAYELLPEGVYDLNRVLVRLQERERELARELEHAANRERAAENLRAQLEREREALQEERRNLKRKFLEEKDAWLRNVRQQVEQQIAHLASRDEVLAAKRQIQTMQDEVRRELQTFDRDAPFAPSALDRFQPGRRVRVEFLHDEGDVVRTDPVRQRLVVRIRNVEVEVTPDQAVLLEETPTAEKPLRPIRGRPRQPISHVLDLHGLRAEQAIARLDKFIDLALQQDIETLHIRHGRGTGTLRKACHEFLRAHRSVRSFRLADQPDGGDGVTIVELK